MEAVVIHCLAVNPCASENWEPFSTMYLALHTWNEGNRDVLG